MSGYRSPVRASTSQEPRLRRRSRMSCNPSVSTWRASRPRTSSLAMVPPHRDDRRRSSGSKSCTLQATMRDFLPQIQLMPAISPGKRCQTGDLITPGCGITATGSGASTTACAISSTVTSVAVPTAAVFRGYGDGVPVGVGVGLVVDGDGDGDGDGDVFVGEGDGDGDLECVGLGDGLLECVGSGDGDCPLGVGVGNGSQPPGLGDGPSVLGTGARE